MRPAAGMFYGLVAWCCAAPAAHAVTTADFSRYQVILDRNPFGEIAPIVVPGVEDLAVVESFDKNYEMKAIIDDGDKLQVCVLDKKTNKHIYLDIGQEISGLELVSVNYDHEEAVLKTGRETIVIRLRPDKDKDKGAVPVMAGAPFSPSDQDSGSRKPFFSSMRRRGASPFQRMGTNAPFQSRGLESFFKPNTNVTTPFVSPFHPQAAPFKPVSAPGDAGQEEPIPASPFMPVNPPAQAGGSAAAGQPAGLNQQIQAVPGQGYLQTPLQPAMMPTTVPVVEYEIIEIEE